ncbi:DUF2235 domain-containing protein [Fodinibius saliphilus]|uniref:DUF2235 domain-containing protein n=1 Tax=Fodinibius saliphilus TaxID=1920650 RepID=UPI0011084D27|nr:DUF2235 domain-containing protein [Fodinibius saliphilus]
MPKNIVILSDGTGQEGGVGHNTNVYKIFNIIEDRTEDQIVYYDPGLGTHDSGLLGMLSGFGISKNIKDCYRFLFENFEAGDKIFLIGFSRGAATVRSLSSLVHYFGILPKSRPDLITEAYEIYKVSNEERRKAQARRFIDKHHTMWARITFMGCFDTVSALGFPIQSVSVLLDQIPFFQHRFHNLRLSESVENAYHALAVDDKRKTFHPALWRSRVKDYQSLEQVWFPGMHTDVGGGYQEHALSDISLNWMCRKAVKHGLKMYDKERIQYEPDAVGIMHDSRSNGINKLYRKEVRYWPESRREVPVIHESVLKRAENRNYRPWILESDYEVESWQPFL